MDFEPSEIIAKIKDNKLAIPAIVIGVGIGAYLLYEQSKNGGLSAVGVTPIDQAPADPIATGGDAGSGSSGGSSSSTDNGLSDLQSQIAQIESDQGTLGKSFSDALNSLSDSLFGQLNSQAQDFQNALNSQAQNNGGSQPYYPDGYATSLDASNQGILGGLQHLFDYNQPQAVSENAVTPEDLFHTSAIANKQNLIAQEVALETQKRAKQIPQIIHIQLPPVQNLINNVQRIVNGFQNLQLPAPIQSYHTPNYDPYPASHFSDIGSLSGFGKALSTAPKITAQTIAANKASNKGGSNKVYNPY